MALTRRPAYVVFDDQTGRTIYRTRHQWIARLIAMCSRWWICEEEEPWTDEVWELPEIWKERN